MDESLKASLKMVWVGVGLDDILQYVYASLTSDDLFIIFLKHWKHHLQVSHSDLKKSEIP